MVKDLEQSTPGCVRPQRFLQLEVALGHGIKRYSVAGPTHQRLRYLGQPSRLQLSGVPEQCSGCLNRRSVARLYAEAVEVVQPEAPFDVFRG